MFEAGICWNAYDSQLLTTQEEISLLQKYGFNHMFPDTFDPTFDEICQAAKKSGIVMDFAHGTFRGINSFYSHGEDGPAYVATLKNDIDACARYEIPGVIVHLSSSPTPPRIDDLSYSRWCEVIEYGNTHGVRLHFENIRTVANLACIMEWFPDVGFCWDVGHEVCFAHGIQFMPLFGKRLSALHLHDNNGIYNEDLHALPYDCRLDYDRIARQIAESGFEGTLMLEVLKKHNQFYDHITPDEYYAKAAKAVDRLRTDILTYKNSK